MKETVSRHWSAQGALKTPRRRDDLRASELDGEVVLFDPPSEKTYHFNATAYAVWQQCEGAVTVAQMAHRLTDRYDVDYDTALDHVEQLVALFAESQLLQPEPDS